MKGEGFIHVHKPPLFDFFYVRMKGAANPEYQGNIEEWA